MRKRCRQLLEETGQNAGPVALDPILTLLGARREVVELPSAGRLQIDRQGYRVCVQAGERWERARFTVAHEIGHILLCEALKAEASHLNALQAPEHWRKVERLCNLAAAEILMPSQDFVDQASEEWIDSRVLRRLYQRYKVSLSALALRFTDAFGLSVSLWSHHRRHHNERETFRVARSWGRGDGWLPPGITERYLRPDLINRADAEGDAWGYGTLSLGNRQRPVAAAAISLAALRPVEHQAPLTRVYPVESTPKPSRILLFVYARNHPKGLIAEHSRAPQQLVLSFPG